jgi:hypothetical protein
VSARWVGDEDGYGDTKGWDRVSIAFHSRRYRPPLTPDDVRLPKEPSSWRNLGICFVCGVCLTFLYVWFPLLFVSLVLSLSLGYWYPGVLGGALVGLTLVLFAVSVRETRQLRGSAGQL